MHELSIAQEIFKICLREVEGRSYRGRMEKVKLRLGELAGVEPSLLQSAWEVVVAGTRHEGCLLDVEFLPAVQECQFCGPVVERAAGSWLRVCPKCGMPLVVSGSDEIEVVSLELEENGG